MEYQSPGGAFTNGVDQFLMQRQQEQRQAMLDSITQRKELAQEQQMQSEMQQAKDALDEKRRATDLAMNEKEGQDFDKRVMGPNGMMRGDIPDASMLALDKKHGRGYFQPLEPGGTPVFVGGLKERESLKQEQKVKDLLAGLGSQEPGSPEYTRTLIGLDAAGVKIPAGAIRMVPTHTRLLLNPKTGVYKDPTGHVVTDVPSDAVVDRMSDPVSGTNVQPQMFQGPDGKIHAMQFVNGQAREIPLPEGFTKPSSSERKTSADKKTGLNAVSRLGQDIDEASAAGLIGPASGRVYSTLTRMGTTGDPEKDKIIGRLKSSLLLMKMHVDAGIGGVRAAASPLLLKSWEDVAMSSSKDLLHGYLESIKNDLTDPTGAPAAIETKPTTADLDARANALLKRARGK